MFLKFTSVGKNLKNIHEGSLFLVMLQSRYTRLVKTNVKGDFKDRCIFGNYTM